MALKDLSYTDGAMALITAMGRLTVLRPILPEPPMQALYALLHQLLQQDAISAADSYHGLTHTLLTGGCRRISGDLFRDFLLYILLERENHFSILAAQNYWDEPLCAAMRSDLTQLTPFFELNSVTLKRWLGDCYRTPRQKPRPQRDNIAVISSAVWGGAGIRPLPALNSPNESAGNQPTANQTYANFSRSLDEQTLPGWRYQSEALPETQMFVADSALEELYRRLDTVADKGVLLDDIWSFHAAYGSGMFIRDRLFTLRRSGGLAPVSTELLPQEDSYTFYQAQRDKCLYNAIRFMRGEPALNMLITGDAGTGKTTQVFSLCRELPELRLIWCLPGRYDALAALVPQLMQQPLKVLVFLDDFDVYDPGWPTLKAALAPAGVQPENILAVAAARKAEASFFPMHVQLPPPQLKEFIELVQLMLLREGKNAHFDAIQNACIDYAASVGGAEASASPLSFRSAKVITYAFNTDQ